MQQLFKQNPIVFSMASTSWQTKLVTSSLDNLTDKETRIFLRSGGDQNGASR